MVLKLLGRGVAGGQVHSLALTAQHRLARELGWQVARWGPAPPGAVLACGLP